MKVGVLFPGQGSQFVGMGGELFDARPDLLGDRANELLGFSLRDVCLVGPEEELTRTEHAQPALFALSYALWEELAAASGLRPDGAAGHSLGEYTALAASGALSYESSLGVVATRGNAMAEAADLEESGMAAVLGADEASARALCDARTADNGRLDVANINAPGQVVVAGGKADIEWLVDNAKDLGFRRAIPLKVAGAFHSGFMEPAVAKVAGALTDVAVGDMVFPVWANTTAKPHQAATLKEVLARQMVEPVLFAQSLEDMSASGIDTFIHVGPGDVTAGLARRTIKDAEVLTVSTLSDIPDVADAIVTMSTA